MTTTPQVPAIPGTTPLGINPMVRVHQALAVRQGLKTYLATGMKLNSAYTPKRLVATAARITALPLTKHTRGGMDLAIMALDAWLEAQAYNGGQS